MSRRDAIVAFIAEFHARHGYAPTVREVGAGVGLSSPSTVHDHLRQLQYEGRVDFEPDSPRTLRVV